MEKEPLVSIIVTVYNQEPYIGKCLKSIVNQTYRNLQIIVVNDGSTDGSLNIIERYKETDCRIDVISKENDGVAFARRDGLNAAKGLYVVFVDGDDYLLPFAIQNLVELSEKYQVDSVIGDFNRKVGPVIRKVHSIPKTLVNRLIQGKELMDKYYISYFGINILPVYVWGRIYRKAVIDKAMQDEVLHRKCWYEDEFFNVMLYPYLSSLYVTDTPVCVYRYGGITCGFNKKFAEIFDFSDIRIRLLDKFNYEKGYQPLFVEYKNYVYTELLQRIQYLHQNKNTLTEYIKTELSSRYLVKRMKEYYNGDCPNYMRPLIDNDYESIYLHALDLTRANRKRFMFKKVFSYANNLLKFF